MNAKGKTKGGSRETLGLYHWSRQLQRGEACPPYKAGRHCALLFGGQSELGILGKTGKEIGFGLGALLPEMCILDLARTSTVGGCAVFTH